MAAVQCKMEIPQVDGLVANQLTVGREFILVCEGDFAQGLNAESMQFVLEEKYKFIIHLLDFEFRSPTQADIRVTGYQAGKFQIPDLQMTDGTTIVSLGPVQYQIETVLPQPEEGQPQTKQEPYGPMGPMPLPIPIEYWAILAAFIGAMILLLVTKIYRIFQRKQMLERLKEHDSSLSPLAQLHQKLRRLQRNNTVFFGGAASAADIKECMEESDKMFRLYILRRFQVPAFDWSDRVILGDIKKNYPKVFSEHGSDLKKLMKELSRGMQDKEKLTETDVLNITTRMRVLSEEMERAL